MEKRLTVDDRHFEYLRLQKGSLDKFAGDRRVWHEAYEHDLWRQYENIAPWLPDKCGALLDVGSGLGGIDVLIYRHYQAAPPMVHLLDGIEDAPRVILHRRTFNNMSVAAHFQQINGVAPARLAHVKPGVEGFQAAFDLVVSFGAWCFHFPPAVYLPALLAGGVRSGTVLILDVRTGKPDWLEDLCRVFELRATIHTKAKFRRYVFRAP